MKKVGNKSNRGGAREGAGRPTGQTKKKISISVTGKVLEAALLKWKGKASPLIEKLLQSYVD
jgi:hypothetical protein